MVKFEKLKVKIKSFINSLLLSCILILSTLHNAYGFGPKFCDPQAEAPSFEAQTRTLNPVVLQLALTSYNCAVTHGYDKQQILTIIDYSLPSTEKRLWVLDLANKKILMNTLVAHGRGSGGLMAQLFSDRNNTHASSLGLFLTANSYVGHDGNSLRLIGLEKGFNDQAFSRNIVIHGAWYVNEEIAKKLGRLGLSWGCPAVPENQIGTIINLIKNGTLVFAYYPDKNWLQNSKFLHCNMPTYITSEGAYNSSPSLFQRIKTFFQNRVVNSK